MTMFGIDRTPDRHMKRIITIILAAITLWLAYELITDERENAYGIEKTKGYHHPWT